jgi:outer membrane lipoprotein-sorting protein
MENESSDHEDLLDRVLEHIRQQEVPPCPGWDVVSGPRGPGFGGRSWTLIARRVRSMKRPISGVAAALAIAFGLGILSLNPPSGQGGSAAFAEVQEAIGSSGSVRFHLLHFTGDDPPTVTTAMWLGPDRLRVELPGGDVIVEDLKARERMRVSHRDRTAVIEPLYVSTDYSSAKADFLQKLRNVPGQATRKLGERTVDGRKLIDFSVKFDGGESKVTVDASTKLPIRIEVSHPPRPGGKAIREVTTDFVFDASLDESLFQVVPPAGYTVTRHTRGEPNPQDTSSLVVSPETGIGPAKFGMSRDDIVRALGEPNWRKEHRYADNLQPRPELRGKDAGQAKYVVTELGYDSRGFRLTINNRGGLHSIHCFNQTSMGPSVRGFQGKTREGIELGASPEDVKKAYGEPEAKMDPDHYWYAKRGWRFFFRDGKLVGYQANPPDPALEVEVLEDGTFMMRRAK